MRKIFHIFFSFVLREIDTWKCKWIFVRVYFITLLILKINSRELFEVLSLTNFRFSSWVERGGAWILGLNSRENFENENLWEVAEDSSVIFENSRKNLENSWKIPGFFKKVLKNLKKNLFLQTWQKH